MSQLTELIDSRIANPVNARKAARAARIDTRLAAISASVPTDDGVSIPGAPTTPQVGSADHAIEFLWDPPLASDHVHNARLWYAIGPTTVTPPANANVDPTDSNSFGILVETQGSTFTEPGWIPGQTIRAYVQFVNIWGRRGPWTNLSSGPPYLTIGGTRIDTVQDQIDFAQASILNTLGYSNIEQMTAAIAATALGTGAITTGHVAAGQITAGKMAVQDAAAINLWVQNAAIESAKIASLVADKITTGSITTASITLGTKPVGAVDVAGSLQVFDTSVSATAPVTRLNANGLSLFPLTTVYTPTNTSTRAKITDTSATPFSSINTWWDTTGAPQRGLVLKAYGAASGQQGAAADTAGRVRIAAIGQYSVDNSYAEQTTNLGSAINVVAPSGDAIALSGANINMSSEKITLTARDIGQNVNVSGGLIVTDNGITLNNSGGLILNGASSFASLGSASVTMNGNATGQYVGQWTTGFVGVANGVTASYTSLGGNSTGQRIFHCQHRTSAETSWRQAAVSYLTAGVVHTRVVTDGSEVAAVNDTGSSQTIRFTVFN